MDTVKVNKDKLREIVQKNRDNHRALFERAFEGYKRTCIEILETNLAAFKAGKAARMYLVENPPEDHTKDYDRVILMLAMNIEEEISLSADDFSHYAMDDWQWKEAWTISSTKYLK